MFLKSVRINNLVFVRLGIKLWSGVGAGQTTKILFLCVFFFLSNLLLFWFEGLVGCGGVRLLLTEVSPS